MARADLISLLAAKKRKATKFNFDALIGPRIYQLLSPYDVQLLDDISRDPKLVTKLDERIKYNDEIFRARGFIRVTQGTNRAVYKFLEDQSFVFKTAISVKGREDSPKEFYNQQKLKPFIAKCFDVSPTGIVGSFERVQDITSKRQFYDIAPLVFDLLHDHILGRYVMADIGTEFFRNYGIRLGFGPVLLDYPLLFEVDGEKLFCNAPVPPYGIPCGGEIDYDAGCNFLYCEKCGKQYSAKQLEKNHIIDNNSTVLNAVRGRRTKMKVVLREGDKIINETVYDTRSAEGFAAARASQVVNKGPKVVVNSNNKNKKRNQPQRTTEQAEQALSEASEIEIGEVEGIIGAAQSLIKNIQSLEAKHQDPIIDKAPVVETITQPKEEEPDDKEETVDTDEPVNAAVEEDKEDESETPIGGGSDEEDNESDGEYTSEDPVEDFLQNLTNIEEFASTIKKSFEEGNDQFTVYYPLLKTCIESVGNLHDKCMETTQNPVEEDIDMSSIPAGAVENPDDLNELMKNM